MHPFDVQALANQIQMALFELHREETAHEANRAAMDVFCMLKKHVPELCMKGHFQILGELSHAFWFYNGERLPACSVESLMPLTQYVHLHPNSAKYFLSEDFQLNSILTESVVKGLFDNKSHLSDETCKSAIAFAEKLAQLNDQENWLKAIYPFTSLLGRSIDAYTSIIHFPAEPLPQMKKEDVPMLFRRGISESTKKSTIIQAIGLIASQYDAEIVRNLLKADHYNIVNTPGVLKILIHHGIKLSADDVDAMLSRWESHEGKKPVALLVYAYFSSKAIFENRLKDIIKDRRIAERDSLNIFSTISTLITKQLNPSPLAPETLSDIKHAILKAMAPHFTRDNTASVERYIRFSGVDVRKAIKLEEIGHLRGILLANELAI